MKVCWIFRDVVDSEKEGEGGGDVPGFPILILVHGTIDLSQLRFEGARGTS